MYFALALLAGLIPSVNALSLSPRHASATQTQITALSIFHFNFYFPPRKIGHLRLFTVISEAAVSSLVYRHSRAPLLNKEGGGGGDRRLMNTKVQLTPFCLLGWMNS